MIWTMQRAAAIAIAALTTNLTAGSAGAESVSDFYKGRDLTILVPSGTAGLNALYARTVGDRWVRHIPGMPKVVYRYMPGRGGIKGANHCYKVAPKDCTVVCVPFNSLAVAQFLRPKGIKYDAGKFHYLGNASDMSGPFAVWHGVLVTSLMDARKTEVVFIGSDKSSQSYNDPAIVNSLFGTKFKVVTGFKGGRGDRAFSRER
jgi:tripartite-type tricarboxylate transporter receptor subunit TctC